jgi:hypothetical protein
MKRTEVVLVEISDPGDRTGSPWLDTLSTDAAMLTPAEEAALDEAVASARQLADHARAAVAAAEALRDEIRRARQEVRSETD